MKKPINLQRTSYLMGTKIRSLRKQNNLTMEDLSSRCIRENAEAAPSVSYLSMIERGKRVPGEDVIRVIATVFQKSPSWFLDDASETKEVTPVKGTRGGISGMALEPSFLFSPEIMQIAIPEMLSQTGTNGRQFAHLLIRAYQENHQNHFPDLERAAEEVGLKRMPLNLDEIYSIVKHHGLKLKWFRDYPEEFLQESQGDNSSVISSYFSQPDTVYLNEILKSHSDRLKYDLAVHIGHSVLHNKDGLKSVLVAGRNDVGHLNSQGYANNKPSINSSVLNAQDILHAWRDFECSFFAGALLCPKVPFRQLLDRHGNELNVNKMLGTTVSVVMRRMTAVSPYPHWHYFDAYTDGKFKAVYRANGIPLPWGNMRLVEDPCQHWSVFRMIKTQSSGTAAQISIMNVADEPRIYCCESIKVKDLAGESHILCTGIDLNPAIESRGTDASALANELQENCIEQGGAAKITNKIKADLVSVSKILNIGWVERGIQNEAQLICSRGSNCPREPSCY